VLPGDHAFALVGVLAAPTVAGEDEIWASFGLQEQRPAGAQFSFRCHLSCGDAQETTSLKMHDAGLSACGGCREAASQE
jgi:hypothetical protein